MLKTELFTVEDGLKVQADDLAFWEKVLKPDVYSGLKAHVERINADAVACGDYATGFDVFRGGQVGEAVMNCFTSFGFMHKP